MVLCVAFIGRLLIFRFTRIHLMVVICRVRIGLWVYRFGEGCCFDWIWYASFRLGVFNAYFG